MNHERQRHMQVLRPAHRVGDDDARQQHVRRPEPEHARRFRARCDGHGRRQGAVRSAPRARHGRAWSTLHEPFRPLPAVAAHGREKGILVKAEKREPLVTPIELAEFLQVSPGTARRIMREHGAIQIGHQLRWTNAKLERYLRTKGSRPGCTSERPLKSDSGDEDESGHSGPTTTEASSTPRAPTKPTAPPRLKLLDASSASAPFLQPIKPATLRKRTRSPKH